MAIEDRIKLVVDFRDKLQLYRDGPTSALRQWINQNIRPVRREVVEAQCLKLFTIGPPPAIGGFIMRKVDPFDTIFDAPYGQSMIPTLLDILDQTIGVMSDPTYSIEAPEISAEATGIETEKGYVFIAMPMAGDKPEYDDVQDAIKNAASNCGLHAERVDEVQSNDRITDRLLESIRRAEFVIADLTDGRPNVFYEAGYAYGLGKIPVYVARNGTKIEFDLKDYPIILFSSMRELRDGLEKRLRGIGKNRGAV